MTLISVDELISDEERRHQERHEHILFAIHRFQKDLKLGDWDIRYDSDWKPKWSKDTSARSQVHEGQRVASISIDPEVTGGNLDFHVAHELAHLVLLGLHQMLGQTAAKTGPGGQAIIDWLEQEVERTCNTIAYALTGVTYEPVGKWARKTYAPWVA